MQLEYERKLRDEELQKRKDEEAPGGLAAGRSEQKAPVFCSSSLLSLKQADRQELSPDLG